MGGMREVKNKSKLSDWLNGKADLPFIETENMEGVTVFIIFWWQG